MASQRASRYRRFMDKAISHKGGQIYHTILKKKADVLARPVDKGTITITGDQAQADKQIAEWSKVWQATDHLDPGFTISTPTRDYIAPEVISKDEIAAYRKTISCLKADTAVSYDNLSPKSLRHLGDETLAELIIFYRRCENEQRWPSQWRNAILVMIPEAAQHK